MPDDYDDPPLKETKPQKVEGPDDFYGELAEFMMIFTIMTIVAYLMIGNQLPKESLLRLMSAAMASSLLCIFFTQLEG